MLVAAALAGWIAFVPSAREQLERAGLLDLLGVEIAQARIDTAGSFDARGPVRVIAEEVVEVAFDDRISAIGDGRARRSVEVRADAAGLITSFEVVAGERVEAGSVLARLDNQAEEIALERARIMVADSADNVERLSRLQSTGAVSGVQMRDAELALRSAELEVRQAEVDLAKREIRAPIAGWVGIIDVEEGDRVGTQDALLTITDRSEIYVDFRVPERIVGRIAVGMPFAAMPLAMPDMRLDGTISAIDTTIDRASRTLRLQGRLDNTEDRLRAGMAISIELSLKGDMYPAIDPLAVQWSSEGSYVWVVRDGKVERVPVLIRQRNADSVLVAAEFAPGDQVVTEGVQTLRPGTEVIVVGPVQAALPAPETGTEQQ